MRERILSCRDGRRLRSRISSGYRARNQRCVVGSYRVDCGAVARLSAARAEMGGPVVTAVSGATTGGILAYAGAMAWSSPSLAVDAGATGSIELAPLDGGASQSIVSGHTPVGSLASDGIAIAWLDTDGTAGELFAWTEDAGISALAPMSRPTPLLGYPTSSIAMAGASTAWIEGDATSQQSVLRELTNTDGGVRDAVPLATAVTSDGVILFAIVPTAKGFEVQSFSPAGTQLTSLTVTTKAGRALGVAVDASDVYFTSFDRGEVWRVPRAGGDNELVAGAQDRPLGITVDDGAIYWTNAGSATDAGSVTRAPK